MNLYLRIFTIFMVFILFGVNGVNAQSSKELIAGFTSNIKAMPALEMVFVLIATDAKGDVITKQKGSIMSQGNSYKMINQQLEIYCDGDTKWILNVDNKELIIIKNDPSKIDIVENPMAFLTSLEKGYKFSSKPVNKTIAGKNIQIVDLTPINSKLSYSKISLGIDTSNKYPYSIVYYSKNGSKYSVVISSFYMKNGGWSKEFFALPSSKSNGVEVTDLR